MANSTDAIYSARPSIEIEGERQAALEQGMQRMEIVETIEGLYRCEAEFINWGAGASASSPDFLYFDRALLDYGKSFSVKLDDTVLFDGRIMALEGNFREGSPPLITILAEDRFQDLRMTRRTRSFEDVSDTDVVRKIASDHGFTAEVSADGPTYRTLAQVNQSDLAFMRERARSIDAELWMDGSKIVMKSRANRQNGTTGLKLGADLQSFVATADLATQRTSVTASGWDVAGKSALQHEADESVISGELNGDESGVSILRDAIGERKDTIAHAVPLNANETKAVAESAFKKYARRFIVGRGTATIQAKVRVGILVDLLLLGPLFSGKYYVVEARHVFDSNKGLRTEFIAERPGIGKV
jgi:phage protein D